MAKVQGKKSAVSAKKVSVQKPAAARSKAAPTKAGAKVTAKKVAAKPAAAKQQKTKTVKPSPSKNARPAAKAVKAAAKPVKAAPKAKKPTAKPATGKDAKAKSLKPANAVAKPAAKAKAKPAAKAKAEKPVKAASKARPAKSPAKSSKPSAKSPVAKPATAKAAPAKSAKTAPKTAKAATKTAEGKVAKSTAPKAAAKSAAPKVAASKAAASSKSAPAKSAAPKSEAPVVPAAKPAAAPVASAVVDDKKRARRPRTRVQSNGTPVAAWLNKGTDKPRSSSFIPAPPRAEAPSLVAAPPASSDRLIPVDGLTEFVVRTVPVRVDIEQGGGRTYIGVNPDEVLLRVGEGIEWDFRYLGGADVTVDVVSVEFEQPSPFPITSFRSQKPGAARPHRQLSGPAQPAAVGTRTGYTIRALNMFGTDMASAHVWVNVR